MSKLLNFFIVWLLCVYIGIALFNTYMKWELDQSQKELIETQRRLQEQQKILFEYYPDRVKSLEKRLLKCQNNGSR